jgi:ElaB/YqjD/DUF883 family membrane-anchored ribosome-binding protein
MRERSMPGPKEATMTDIQSLECRIYMIENEMYLAEAQLQRHLHELEHDLKALVEDVHRVLCESGSGRIPGETKAREIVARTRTAVAAIDLGPIEAQADHVAKLKAQIEECDERIASLDRRSALHAVA